MLLCSWCENTVSQVDRKRVCCWWGGWSHRWLTEPLRTHSCFLVVRNTWGCSFYSVSLSPQRCFYPEHNSVFPLYWKGLFAQCSATVKCLTISMFMDFPFPLILSFLSLSERLVLSLKVINSVLHSVTRRMQSCMSEGERLNKVSLKWMWGSRWERKKEGEGKGQRAEGEMPGSEVILKADKKNEQEMGLWRGIVGV